MYDAIMDNDSYILAASFTFASAAVILGVIILLNTRSTIAQLHTPVRIFCACHIHLGSELIWNLYEERRQMDLGSREECLYYSAWTTIWPMESGARARIPHPRSTWRQRFSFVYARPIHRLILLV